MNIELMPCHVLVEVQKQDKTASGIHLAQSWEGGRRIEGSDKTGIVVDVGKGVGRWKNKHDEYESTDATNHVRKGDKIAWEIHTQRMLFEENEKPFAIVHVKNILAKLKEQV